MLMHKLAEWLEARVDNVDADAGYNILLTKVTALQHSRGEGAAEREKKMCKVKQR
jgi:hypothetical protein